MKSIKIMSILLASLFLGACSSDDDSNSSPYTETSLSEAPVWQIDWSYNQERPDWTEPDATAYENWTILMVQMEEALRPYVSDDDMMAVFLNGELRGLAQPAQTMSGEQTDDANFIIKAYGNETGTETVNIALMYYCSQLNHIFTLSDDINFSEDESTGIDEDFMPQFTSGSAKYPQVTVVSVEPLLTAAGITPAAGGKAGVFAGDECRGTATLSASGSTPIVVYGRSAGESLTLKYYDAEKKVMYSILDAVK